MEEKMLKIAVILENVGRGTTMIPDAKQKISLICDSDTTIAELQDFLKTSNVVNHKQARANRAKF